MSQIRCDACVIGAGPAGLAAARALSRQGASVAILSPPARDAFKVGESLTSAALPILRVLGFDAALFATAQLPSLGSLSAWGSPVLVASDAIADPRGAGWHLDRAAFEAALLGETARSGVRFVGESFRGADWQGSRWIVRATSREVAADWIIDATGRRALFARQQGATRRDDSGQLAVVRWTRALPGDEDRRTIVESARDGWWYSSLLPGRVRVVAFHGLGPEVVERCRSLDAWRAALAATLHIGGFVGEGEPLAPPKLVRACGSELSCPFGRNWLAAGDAALAFDPISSLGIFSALYTGLRAAEVVAGKASASGYAERLASIRRSYLENLGQVYAQV